jgi:hypothetical protein
VNPSTNIQPLRSRAERRHRQRGRDAARPQLRIVPVEPRGAPAATAGDVAADLAALVNAGLIVPVRDAAGEIRYRVVDPFDGSGDVDLGVGGGGQ